MKIQDNLELNQNQLIGAVLELLASAPSTPVNGQMYYNTTTNLFGFYNGTSWSYSGYSEVSDSLITTLNNVTGSGVIPDVQWTWVGTPTAKSVLSVLTKLINKTYGLIASLFAAKGDLIIGTGSGTYGTLGIGSNTQVLTVDSTTATGLKWAASGNSASYMYQFSMIGTASGTTSRFCKAATTDANPCCAIPSVPNSGGISVSACDPYIVPANSTIFKAQMKIAHCAVGTGTFTSPATLRITVVRIDDTTQTDLVNLNFQVTNASTYNSIGGDNYATYEITGLTTGISKGDMIGIRFDNQSGNSGINAIRNCFITILAQ